MSPCWLPVFIVLPNRAISKFHDFSSSGEWWIILSGRFTKGNYSECSNLVFFWDSRVWKLVCPQGGDLLIVSLLSPNTFAAHFNIKPRKKWFSVYLSDETWNRDFFSSFCCKCCRNLKKSLDFTLEVKDTRRITFFPILCWNVPGMCSD